MTLRKLERSEVVDFQTYVDGREATRALALAEKARRRIHVGEHLTFLFETTASVRYQVQEMMRLEQMVREKDIQHEIDTYNELLGGRGELGATLLIEIEDQASRDRKLRAWLGLPGHLFVRLEDGSQVRARWDAAQVGEDRLSSVQYLKFPVGDGVPVALGSDHPELRVEVQLTDAPRETLLSDLRDDAGAG
jgi:hypothetical protein